MTVTQMWPESGLAGVVAARVRGLLAEQSMKQGDLAKVMDLSQASVSDRLRGVKRFDLNELPVLTAAFGVSVEYLLGLTDDRSPRRSAPGGGSLFVMDESGTASGTRTPNPLIKSQLLCQLS
jgi:predicted XRE-type DNA-binding protein